MPSLSRSLSVAAVSAGLGLVGLVATFFEFRHVSEVAASDPEGLVTGFAAAFAFTFLVSSVIALGEAGLLAAVVTWADPGPWALRLLAAGAGLGGIATVPRVVQTIGFVTDGSVPVQMLGVWWLFVVAGIFCVGLGILLYVIEPLPRRHEIALQGVLVGIVIVVLGSSVMQLRSDGNGLIFQVGILFTVLGIFSAGLGTVLYAIKPMSQPAVQLVFLLGILAGIVISVLQLLTGAVFMAVLIGIPSLVALWAGWLVVDAERVTQTL